MRGPEKSLRPHELADAVGSRYVSNDVRTFMSLRTKPDILSYLGVRSLQVRVDNLELIVPAPILWNLGDLVVGNAAGSSTLLPAGVSGEQLTAEGTSGKLVWVKDTDYGYLSDDFGSVANAALDFRDYGVIV